MTVDKANAEIERLRRGPAHMTWQTSKPPNEQVVEVECDGTIIRVRAIWGRDGTLPHWESEDRNSLWHPSAFTRWRTVPPSTPERNGPMKVKAPKDIDGLIRHVGCGAVDEMNCCVLCDQIRLRLKQSAQPADLTLLRTLRDEMRQHATDLAVLSDSDNHNAQAAAKSITTWADTLTRLVAALLGVRMGLHQANESKPVVMPEQARGTDALKGRCRWHGDGCRNLDCRDSGRWMDTLSAHDHGNCELCDELEREHATTLARVQALEADNATLLDIIQPDKKPSEHCGHSITYLELRRNDQHMLEVAGCVMCRAEAAEAQVAELEREVERLTPERDGARLVARQMSERLEAAQGEVERLQGYVQHKADCQTGHPQWVDYNNCAKGPPKPCTCGLTPEVAAVKKEQG